MAAAAPAPAQSGTYDGAFLEAQKNETEKQVAALREEQQKQIEDLNRKHAESARGDREKVVQLETKLKESESEISELERRVKLLTEDNLNKDNVIQSLN